MNKQFRLLDCTFRDGGYYNNWNFSKVLNGKIINMNNSLDCNLDMKNLFNFDKHKYQEYKDTYLKFPNSPDVPLWEIFTKYIKKFNYNKTI